MSCNCSVNNAEEVVNKVMEKGFSNEKMSNSYTLKCTCGTDVEMETYLTTCPNCNNIFAVTPCQSDDVNNVKMLER